MSALTLDESVLISPDLKTTSLIVAEKFGREHRNVARAIDNLEIPNDFRLLNFAQGIYTDRNGDDQRCFDMTRDGFALLVMGFTGKKAVEWKIKFLEAFNAMEKALSQPTPAIGSDCMVVSKAEWERLQKTSALMRVVQDLDNQVTALKRTITEGLSAASWDAPVQNVVQGSVPPKATKTEIVLLSHNTKVAILIELSHAWNRQNPYSITPQTKRTSRYAPRALGNRFDIPAHKLEALLLDWCDRGIIKTHMLNTNTKQKGLKVLAVTADDL
jgi:Rha family phage regulatory protein